MSELRKDQVETLYEIAAHCKRIAVLAGPLRFETAVPLELRSRLGVLTDECKHARNYLRSRGLVKEDERWRASPSGRTVPSPPARPLAG